MTVNMKGWLKYRNTELNTYKKIINCDLKCQTKSGKEHESPLFISYFKEEQRKVQNLIKIKKIIIIIIIKDYFKKRRSKKNLMKQKQQK